MNRNSTYQALLLLIVCFLFWQTKTLSQSFTKVTNGPVVNTPGDSRSVNWVDVNADGWQDLMITNGPSGGQNNFLYLNDGNGGFTAVVNDPIVEDDMPSDGATFADSDNDGDLDCFVANWYNTDNLYYLNNGDGSFTAVTGTITDSGGYCETASWGDFDLDGLVDLYVTNSAGTNKNLLYHNDGNNAFTKILDGPMVNDMTDSRGINWTDIDWDGDVDLFVVNESDQGQYAYRNDPGEFVTVGENALVENEGTTMSGSWGDYDNDGDLDVFLARYGMNNALFRNEGINTWSHMSLDTVSNTSGHSFSSAWGDIDNDSDLDLFVTNGFYSDDLLVNYMYLNNGDGNFTRLDNIAPVQDLTWSYGCAFGDYDNDGFLDLAVATVRFEGNDYPDLLYHNDGNENNWITITLEGTTINRSAIGTKVWVSAIIDGVEVWQVREISAQSAYCSQNDLRAHFGLGDAGFVESIVVEWIPGFPEFYETDAINEFIKIVEGQGIVGNIPSSEQNTIAIYPNPANEVLRINLTQLKPDQKLSYKIADLKGRSVQSGFTSHNEIDIRLLDAGTYVLIIELDGQEFKQQFIRVN